MNDEQERNGILRKIRACLSRADANRNDSEEERAIALRQANALMDKYGIQAVDLGETDELGERGKHGIDTGRNLWKAVVIQYIGKLYGCKVYRSPSEGRTWIIGREHFRHVVVDMAGYVISSIEREASHQARGRGRSFGNSFRRGAASAIGEQVKEILASRARGETAQVSSSKAMILVDMYKNELALNDEWLRAQGVRLYSGGRRRISSGDGYHAGQQYGRGIGLQDQLGRGPSARVKRIGNG